MSRAPFATVQDVQARHPREAALLCADEATRQPAWPRFDAALDDASGEMRAILAARYPLALLDALDEDSAGVLRLYAIDIALYRAALSVARLTDEIKERYLSAIKRLQGIARGQGALSFAPGAGAGENAALASPGAPQIEAPERQFTREKTAGWR